MFIPGEMSWKHSYLFRREILHAPGHAISENREIPGCQGCRILAEVVEVLPGTVITQIREQLAVHDVFQYEIMRLCNQRKSLNHLRSFREEKALEHVASAFRIRGSQINEG